jgi:hypothetical protein
MYAHLSDGLSDFAVPNNRNEQRSCKDRCTLLSRLASIVAAPSSILRREQNMTVIYLRPAFKKVSTALFLALLVFFSGYGASAGVNASIPASPQATITVTTTGDTLDAGGGNCAAITVASLPGPDGLVSLREAVCAANNTAGNDIINFSGNGTYTLTRVGVDDTNSNGDLDLLSNITINGNGSANTILDGNNTDRIFDIDPLQNANNVVSISGVTVRNGHADPATFNLGAGIATGASSETTISNSTITANNSVNGTGGGIESFGRLTLTSSTVSNNTADAQGGGIRAIRAVTITLSTITGNTSETGGGMWLGTAAGITQAITDTTISNNHAVDRPINPNNILDGGGVYIDTDGSVVISRSTISGNDAARNGGGIYFRDQPGGAVAAVTLTNDTLSGNRANNSGGGVYEESGSLAVNYSTIPLNRADHDNTGGGQGGGAFRVAGTAGFANSILAGNILGSGSADDCSAGLTSNGYNLFGNNTVCPSSTGDQNLASLGLAIGAVINTTLGNNGGPTLTHALILSQSNPAIDTANPSGCVATDQRGTARPIGTRCDKGSYESITPPTPTSTPTSTPTITRTPTVTNTPSVTTTPTRTATRSPTNSPSVTPTVQTVALLVGHVTWQGRPAQPNALQQVPITLSLQLGGNITNYPGQNTDASGFFTTSVSGLVSGTYNWRVKGPLHLANCGTVPLTGAPQTNQEMGQMRTGDANDDNLINVLDFNVVKGTFGKSPGDPGYDARGDFNGDGLVNILDFNLIKQNFGTGGCPALAVPTGTPTNTATNTPTNTSTPSRTNTPTATPTIGLCGTLADYVVSQSTGVTLVAGTTDIGNHCDDCTTNVILPFTYLFYGQPFTSANLNSNGTLEFSGNNLEFSNGCLPEPTFNNAIFPHWDDLRTDTVGSGIFISTSGVAPSRIFNIEWRATYFTGGFPVNFEVRLYEGQNRFDVLYDTVSDAGLSATVGVQKGTGSQFTQFECGTGSLVSGLQLNFSQPATNYQAVTATATLVAGTTDTGNHCDDCMTNVALPFAYTLYDQSFTMVNVGSNGTLQFNSADPNFTSTCLPNAIFNFTVLPLWVDQCTGPCGSTPCSGCGVFTSVSGTAPRRIFNIEWRTDYFDTGIALGYEVRLYEGETHFDVIYSTVPNNGDFKTIGVQKDTGSHFLQYQCGTGIPASGTLVKYTLTSCTGLK